MQFPRFGLRTVMAAVAVAALVSWAISWSEATAVFASLSCIPLVGAWWLGVLRQGRPGSYLVGAYRGSMVQAGAVGLFGFGYWVFHETKWSRRLNDPLIDFAISVAAVMAFAGAVGIIFGLIIEGFALLLRFVSRRICPKSRAPVEVVNAAEERNRGPERQGPE